jgi:hypothetical protein
VSRTEDLFVRFLATGTLNEVALGWMGAAVRKRLGPPSETAKLRRGITLWAYGGRVVQVTFERNRVVLIGIYMWYASVGSADLLGGGVPLPPKTDRAMLKRQLEAWHVHFSESREWPGSYEVGDAGVLAAFDDEGNLYSFQLAPRAGPARQGKGPRPRQNTRSRGRE